MSANPNSTIDIIFAIFGICSAAGFIYFISKLHDLPRGMKYRLIVRRACLILLFVSGIVATMASRQILWERRAFVSMLFFAFAYAAFPVYSLVQLVASGLRKTTPAKRPESQ